jgi:hypothetical protein
MKFTHLIASASCLFAGAMASAETLRAYHIGNSVTDTIRYNALRAMAAANADRGNIYEYGRHTIPGAPLEFIWNNPNGGFGEPSTYPTALPNNDWDVLTLQPFDRSVNNDQDHMQRFIDLMRSRPANADTQVYVYQRWPRRLGSSGNYTPIDYPAVYSQPHVLLPSQPGFFAPNNLEVSGFYEALIDRVRQNNAGVGPEIKMIPVGDVLNEIDARLRAGQIRGISGTTRPTLNPGTLDINILYPDGIHFGNLGNFIVGTTFYATMFKDDPRGLVVPTEYKLAADNPSYRPADFNFPGMLLDANLPSITNETILDLQDAIWDVVSVHPYSGVPEPGTLGALAILSVVLMRRNRA